MNTFNPKRILTPMDWSEPALAALRAAEWIGKRFRSTLELVYFQDLPLSLAALELDGDEPAVQGMLREIRHFARWREGELRRAAGSYPKERVVVKALEGWPPAGIVKLAAKTRADLIVMGTHGYSGLDRALYGSVAEAVLRRASVPVLAVHRDERPFRVSKMLVPCGMSPYADKALRYALDFARAMKAKPTVLYVAPPGAGVERPRELLAGHLARVLGRTVAEKLPLRLSYGDPRTVILREAELGGFDLIGLSAHRRRFSRDFVLGSTVERVLRHSTIPVLAVPSIAPTETRGRVQKAVGGKIY